MKPPLRKTRSWKQFALLEERARGAGLRLAEWVREASLAAPVESGPDAAEVALAEVLALRSRLFNLHFGAAPRAEMRSLIQRDDAVKTDFAERRGTNLPSPVGSQTKLRNSA
jgi:hypothetical protein